MQETLSILPIPFWVTLLLLIGGGAWAVTKIQTGLGLPMLAVLGTVAAWYVGDVFYNDYAQTYAKLFTPEVLDVAWWQLAWFVTVFLLLSPGLHKVMSHQLAGRSSNIYHLIQTGLEDPQFEWQIGKIFWGAFIIWLGMVAIAFYKLGDQILYYFCPYLAYKADPWARGQVGQGWDAVWSLLVNLQMFLTVVFGLVTVLMRNSSVRRLALASCLLLWPYYIFDRVRNSMLVVFLPPLMAWVFVRIRSGWMVRLTLLLVSFTFINVWFSFIIANRSATDIAVAIHGEGVSLKEAATEAKHEGLNMFEELCWVNKLIADKQFTPNQGQNYFANLVNPIPRSLWRGKPMIGLDYAVARGQEYTEGGGTTATISTGLIGQGVVNFDRYIGPAFAALLLGLWASFLARCDLQGQNAGYLGIYLLGMIETYNLGRDITFIALYPVIFGLPLVWWSSRSSQGMAKRQRRKPNYGT